VRGKIVVIFTNAARNPGNLPVAENKIELYMAVEAAKRSQADRIIVFEPFVSCSRSDRTSRRNSVGLWVHFKILTSLGADHIITYQMHSDKSKSMLDPTICAIDDIAAYSLLQKFLCDHFIQNMETLENKIRPNWAFCSVDAGGEQMARHYANAFGAPLVVAHKQRDYTKTNPVESVNILSAEPITGKTLWIVDDMIDTAGSVDHLVRALAPFHPGQVNIMTVHPVFSAPATERLTALHDEGLLNSVVVTDTILPPEGGFPGLEVVSSVELSAKIIRCIETNSPMSRLLEEFNVRKYLTSNSLFPR
jgi:ribose-phosphate pyrophosphokinase